MATSASALGSGISPESIAARLDRLPGLTKRHVGLAAVLTSLFFFDIVDLSSFAFVAPALMAEWNLTIEQLGLLTSTAFAGMFLGGLIGGRLADRFGRRPIVLIGVTIFSLASLASAFAPTPEVLGGLRLITGFGLQMATGAILVIVSESFPKPFRGRVMAVVLAVSSLGTPVIALISRVVVPAGLWHVVFLVGALGIIPALFAFRLLPETPRWLAVNGRTTDADRQLRGYEEQSLAKHGTLPPVVVPSGSNAPVHGTSMLDLFRRGLLSRTIVAVLAFCGLILLNYGFASWLPVILVGRGYPQEEALTFSFILSFALAGGAMLATVVVDRVERKTAIVAGVVVMAVCYLAVGFIDSVPVLLLAGFLANVLSQGVSAIVYAYVPEMFPTSVRGVGAGLANGVGRVAGIFSGVIVAAVIVAFTMQGVFVYLAVVAVLMGVVVSFGPITGVRAARRQLRQERALTDPAPADAASAIVTSSASERA